MTNKIRVLIAAKDGAEKESIVKAFKETGSIIVTDCVSNGKDLYEAGLKSRPDVIVSELMLPIKDGLAAYAELKESGYEACFIALSPFFSEKVVSDAESLKVSQLVLMPCDYKDLADKVINYKIAPKGLSRKEESVEVQVTAALHELGLPSHVNGFEFVRTAIIMSVEDMGRVRSITKILYPAVAIMYNSTTSRVERAIRHSIEVAWNRADVSVLNKEFGYTISETKGKPTNAEFISMIADKIRLKRKFG